MYVQHRSFRTESFEVHASITFTAMHAPYSAAASQQIHATLPNPDGTYGCVTLYEICPHAAHRSPTESRREDSYSFSDAPPLSSARPRRTVEHRGRRILETPPTLIPLPRSQRARFVQQIDNEDNEDNEDTEGYENDENGADDNMIVGKPTNMVRVQRPQDPHISKSLAPLTLSKYSPVGHHMRKSTMTAPLRSILKKPSPPPTIYLLTFSADRVPAAPDFADLLHEHLAPQVDLRYTIDARRFLAPPPYICDKYSGVSDEMQDQILEDSVACGTINRVVDDLVDFVQDGGRETCVAVYCKAGTHRSVALAELIAQGVRQEIRDMKSDEGVKIVVRHVHRVKGPKDPY